VFLLNVLAKSVCIHFHASNYFNSCTVEIYLNSYSTGIDFDFVK